MRNRLRPVDTSSPRSTIEGFLESVNRTYTLVMEADAALKASPPTITRDEASEMEVRTQNLMERAQGTLDLSKVPQAIREDVGMEAVLQLKEIFDRMLLPPIDVIPDAEMVKAERKHLGSTASGKGKPVRWRIPNTTIEIVEIMEGENQGKFLFSANTVRRLNHFYEEIRSLPYRRDYTHLATEYLAPEKTEGFYDYYISTPGYLIQQGSLLGQLVERLPGWFKTLHGGQTVWQWISLVLSLSLSVLILVMFHGVLLRRPAQLSSASRHWRRVFFNLVAMGMLYLLLWILDDTVNLTGSVLNVARIGLTMFFWFFLAWGVFFLSNAISETIIASPKIDPDGAKASIFRATFGIAGFIAMATLVITGLHKVGVSLVPLLASVGISGLAFALAARPALENVIGSFMIFLDKPCRIGQRVNILGHNGTVESIGLRSTKIRLLTGHQTSIPNEKMATAEIENIGRRPFIRRRFNVTITYDTPPEKIIRAEEILKEILAVPEAPDPEATDSTEELAEIAGTEAKTEQEPHPNEAINRPSYPPRVYFNDLNADSLNIVVYYWYHPPEYWNYLEHARWVNIQIMERFKAEGIDFAFPTQTLHLAGDDKQPLTVGQRWVSKEEAFSPSAVLAQAAALGAQAVHTTQLPASESKRSKPKPDKELTGAPVEDELLHGDDEGETDETEPGR